MKIKTNFDKKQFNSSMLQVGEMMEIDEGPCERIILRTFDGFVLLNNPRYTCENDMCLKGRKLLPGESITLIQE